MTTNIWKWLTHISEIFPRFTSLSENTVQNKQNDTHITLPGQRGIVRPAFRNRTLLPKEKIMTSQIDLPSETGMTYIPATPPNHKWCMRDQNPKRNRTETMTCPLCSGKDGVHSKACKDASKERIIELLGRSETNQRWARKRALYWCTELTKMHASLMRLKHENSILRKRLKDNYISSSTPRKFINDLLKNTEILNSTDAI